MLSHWWRVLPDLTLIGGFIPRGAEMQAPLQQVDGQDVCPPCLGVEHLQEGLTENACSNCSILPRSVRLDCLAALEQPRQPGKETS